MKIYNHLFKLYGPQGWWPVINRKRKNKDHGSDDRGYHPGDYSYPKNSSQKFEICAGAVLTQNTAWLNVEKALVNLNELKLLNAKSIVETKIDVLKAAIKSAGYYNQKAVYLKELAKFFLTLRGAIPARDKLLSVKGIGPETADSILLYAYNQPEFIVDAYTKRMFSSLGLIDRDKKYHEIKKIFEKNIPRDVIIYQEYHALIVEHAKKFHSGRNKS